MNLNNPFKCSPKNKLTLLNVFVLGLSALSIQSVCLANSHAQVSKLEQSLSIVGQTNLEGVESQKRVSKLDEETKELLREYKQTLGDIKDYRLNIQHLEETQITQDQRLKGLDFQLNEVSRTETTIVPMLMEMVSSLDQSIRESLPFHLEERLARIAKLHKDIHSAELNMPDKYRRVLDAYEIERDFGYTIETYKEELKLDHSKQLLKVTLLRVGRIGLFYQSADQQYLGHWNRKASKWEPLPNSYLSSISAGIKMANEQLSPSLLSLPIEPYSMHDNGMEGS